MPSTRSLWGGVFAVFLFCILGTGFQYVFLSPNLPAEPNEKQGGALNLPEGFSLRDLENVTNALIKAKRAVAPETVIVLSMEVVNDKKLLVKVGLKNALEGGYTSYHLHKDPTKKSWEIESGEAVIE